MRSSPISPVSKSASRASGWAVDVFRKARLCEQFLHLTGVEHYSLTAAARMLNKSPATFSGRDSLLARYQRGGLAAMAPGRRRSERSDDLASRLEALGWFIPAVSFLRYSGKGRSLAKAVRQATELPKMPRGWSASTVCLFLKAIGCDVAPSLTPELRTEILERARKGLPGRVVRSTGRDASPGTLRYCFELSAGDAPAFPLGELAAQLASLQPTGARTRPPKGMAFVTVEIS